MNQILYTGGKKKKSSMSTMQKTVIVFVIIIIIFAICAIGIGANLLTKVKNENVVNTYPSGQTGNNTNTNPGKQEEIKVTFDSELGKVKVTVKSPSDVKIESISYWWEGEEKETVEVSNTEYELVVPSKQGTHYLYIEAVDENGNKKEAQQLVIGASGPEITITTDGVSNYVVKVKDDEKIEKITVTLNDKTEEIEVNSKEYEYRVAIPQGDSLIDVTAYNVYELSTNKKAKVRNFGN